MNLLNSKDQNKGGHILENKIYPMDDIVDLINNKDGEFIINVEFEKDDDHDESDEPIQS